MLVVSDSILAKAVLYLLSEETKHRSLDKKVRACAFFLESQDNNLRCLVLILFVCLRDHVMLRSVQFLNDQPTLRDWRANATVYSEYQ